MLYTAVLSGSIRYSPYKISYPSHFRILFKSHFAFVFLLIFLIICYCHFCTFFGVSPLTSFRSKA